MRVVKPALSLSGNYYLYSFLFINRDYNDYKTPNTALYNIPFIIESFNNMPYKALGTLATLAHQWDMKLSQLALAYLQSLPGMGPVIPSSATISQLELNAAAGRMKLSEDQKSQIQQALE